MRTHTSAACGKIWAFLATNMFRSTPFSLSVILCRFSLLSIRFLSLCFQYYLPIYSGRY